MLDSEGSNGTASPLKDTRHGRAFGVDEGTDEGEAVLVESLSGADFILATVIALEMGMRNNSKAQIAPYSFCWHGVKGLAMRGCVLRYLILLTLLQFEVMMSKRGGEKC